MFKFLFSTLTTMSPTLQFTNQNTELLQMTILSFTISNFDVTELPQLFGQDQVIDIGNMEVILVSRGKQLEEFLATVQSLPVEDAHLQLIKAIFSSASVRKPGTLSCHSSDHK